MAYHFNDNVYTRSFTPREPQVELLDAACERNIIVCLCNTSGKTFIASKIISHIANKVDLAENKKTMYVADSPAVVTSHAACLRRLTDFNVGDYTNMNMSTALPDWKRSVKSNQVLVITTQIAVSLLKEEILKMSEISLIILHGCHCVLKGQSVPVKELMEFYYNAHERPRIVGLASSIFTSGLDPSCLEAKINKMERILESSAETASNAVSVLRYSTQPHEVVLECGKYEPSCIDELVEQEIMDAIRFLSDHRYDLNEIYEGFTEELQDMPDPRTEPVEILKELLEILHTLGPWSTDKAAYVLLLYIDKLKSRIPYERHFLLLCMASSVLIKIRAIFDDFFKDYHEKERIYKFSSPKILRLIEIVRKFQPEKSESDSEDFSDDETEGTHAAIEKQDPYCSDKENNSKTPITTSTLSKTDVANSCDIDFDNVEDNAYSTSNCQCSLIHKFLIYRLEKPMFHNVSFKDAVTALQACEIKSNTTVTNLNNDKSDILNEEKLVNELKHLKCTSGQDLSDCHVKPNELCNNVTKLSADQTSVINLYKNCENNSVQDSALKSRKTLITFLQKKNGCVLLPDNEKRYHKKEDNRLNGRKFNESTLRKSDTHHNFSPYHDYLPSKFKFENSRNERFQSMAQMKGFVRDDLLLRQMRCFNDGDPQLLCGLIFVKKKLTAKVLYHVFNDLSNADEDFSTLSVQFTMDKVVDSSKDPKGAEVEHRKQESVLKRFRMRECQLLIGTSFLEEGIDLPKCNLVVRFDVPNDYKSYMHTKERARAADSLFCLLVDSENKTKFIEELAKYFEMEKMLLRKCGNIEPPEDEEHEADNYVKLIKPFCPLLKQDCPYVDLSTAIALVNRYCAKLPSDTFTRLTPIWNVKAVTHMEQKMYVCTIRLPINSPVKQEIEGIPMPTEVLARRFAAFQCCQLLHLRRELDDTLQPISKESFWMREEEQLTTTPEELEEMIPRDSLEPRPGTTKRRQYYYKRIADSLTDCRPVADKQSFLYDISMALSCPLPEEQNTRGRKIHAPEDSAQGFGILTLKNIPKIGPFPIFTRSGEVQVKLQLAPSTVTLSESQIDKIVAFIHYTFTSVLRLQKYLMMFDPHSSENSYFIVPTKRDINGENVEVDWEFLELIYEKRNQVPVFIPEEERKNFAFDPLKFEDAVVSPWYRNQDQPQYFYVAEICDNLSPKSAFPGTEYDTFEEYYSKKYDIQIQNCSQALLDVDHTSARLNFLTPRYVNRKGVALPTTSEEKKRAKRENLEQKQILVPELCNIHPFPATLWRKAVCLPCILHRINALLLADQVRRVVALDIGVGSTKLDVDFNWKPLNFGWSLADVLNQSKASQKQSEEGVKETKKNSTPTREVIPEENHVNGDLPRNEDTQDDEKSEPWIEIGTWSNDMAMHNNKRDAILDDSDELDSDVALPKNVTLIDRSSVDEIKGWNSEISFNNKDEIHYGSPTSWMGAAKMMDDDMSDFMSDNSYSDDYYEDSSSSNDESDVGGLKIAFTEDNEAEAIEDSKLVANCLNESTESEDNDPWVCEDDEKSEFYQSYLNQFKESVDKNKRMIIANGIFCDRDSEFEFTRVQRTSSSKFNNCLNAFPPSEETESSQLFGSRRNTCPQLIDSIPEELSQLPLTTIIIKSLQEHRQRIDSKASEIITKEEEFSEKKTGVLEGDRALYSDDFSFDEQPDLNGHPGPSPSLILQALTMSNANDGINLERLETIGDSFLKYAITTYLYSTYENIHEGKLSHLRSKQVSNFNLYRLGRRKVLGESMIATKFEPHDNWLPPCYYVPRELERALIEAGVPASHWNRADLPSLRNLSKEEICQLVRERGEKLGIVNSDGVSSTIIPSLNLENMPCFIPYNLMTQHSIPDKSIADCVEALIGAYLVACGPRGALLFMSWLGIKVLPREERLARTKEELEIRKEVGCTIPVKVTNENGEMWSQVCFGNLSSPKPPLLRNVADPEGELERLLRGFDVFEDSIKYHFRDRSYLLQALTHASYFPNRLTDCYQRLEFLGDAVLDYLITRHLYEDPRHHSPGALTDLRSALVNNTIFASLAVRNNFHKYFRHLCPGLNEVVDRFVRIQQENGHSISEECYLIEEEECEEAEDVEVPKALGDVFESVAGAIFLDSGMSLDAVWRVYYRIMKNEIELFSTNVPKSPIRELFELEPETAQFGKPEKLADGRRVRVTVEVFGKGQFKGIGRNYRIAKCTAAKCALKQLKRKGWLK